jgi:hypothetical protein
MRIHFVHPDTVKATSPHYKRRPAPTEIRTRDHIICRSISYRLRHPLRLACPLLVAGGRSRFSDWWCDFKAPYYCYCSCCPGEGERLWGSQAIFIVCVSIPIFLIRRDGRIVRVARYILNITDGFFLNDVMSCWKTSVVRHWNSLFTRDA